MYSESFIFSCISLCFEWRNSTPLFTFYQSKKIQNIKYLIPYSGKRIHYRYVYSHATLTFFSKKYIFKPYSGHPTYVQIIMYAIFRNIECDTSDERWFARFGIYPRDLCYKQIPKRGNEIEENYIPYISTILFSIRKYLQPRMFQCIEALKYLILLEIEMMKHLIYVF